MEKSKEKRSICTYAELSPPIGLQVCLYKIRYVSAVINITILHTGYFDILIGVHGALLAVYRILIDIYFVILYLTLFLLYYIFIVFLCL